MPSEIEKRLKSIRIDGQQAITDTLITIGETSGRVGKGEGNVTRGLIYCRLPELGGRSPRCWADPGAGRSSRSWRVPARSWREFPDLRAGVQLISGIGGGGRNADLQFNLVGPDLDSSSEYADAIIQKLRQYARHRRPGHHARPIASPNCRRTSTARKPASSDCG